MIDRKVEELKPHGIDEEDIMGIIQADLDYNFKQINSSIEQKEIDKELISKIVDSKIIGMVDRFLKRHQYALNVFIQTHFFMQFACIYQP